MSPTASRLLHVTFDDAFRSVVAALPTVRRLGVPATIFVCAGLAGDGAVLQIPELADEARRHPAELATLSWNDLRAIAGDGVRVESHTLTHPHLPLLGDDELEHELRESREAVERELETACRCLAYPYGEYDARVARVAREVGYRNAFALPGTLEGSDPYALPRIGIWRRDGLTRFALKTSPPVRRLSSRHPWLADRFRSPKPRPGTPAEAESPTRI